MADLQLPAFHVVLNVTRLMDENAFFVISSVIYAIRWVNNVKGLTGPTANDILTDMVDATKSLRLISTTKKDAIASDMLVDLWYITPRTITI